MMNFNYLEADIQEVIVNFREDGILLSDIVGFVTNNTVSSTKNIKFRTPRSQKLVELNITKTFTGFANLEYSMESKKVAIEFDAYKLDPLDWDEVIALIATQPLDTLLK